jgi:hypothetical protein
MTRLKWCVSATAEKSTARFFPWAMPLKEIMRRITTKLGCDPNFQVVQPRLWPRKKQPAAHQRMLTIGRQAMSLISYGFLSISELMVGSQAVSHGWGTVRGFRLSRTSVHNSFYLAVS